MGDPSTAPPTRRSGQSGHTLLELLLVLCILAICLALPAVSLVQGLDVVRSRGVCQAWQAAAAQAQLASLWSGGSVAVDADATGIALRGPSAAPLEVTPELGSTEPAANISRWNTASGVSVAFGWPFGSPDAAGSIHFGEPGRGSTVIVRLESGLTHRGGY
jgi:type II secretory pathway pseudopilin PulG